MKSNYDFAKYDAYIDRAVSIVKAVPQRGSNFEIVRYGAKLFLRVVYDYLLQTTKLHDRHEPDIGPLFVLLKREGVIESAKFLKHLKEAWIHGGVTPTYSLFRSATQRHFGLAKGREYLPFVKQLFSNTGCLDLRGLNTVLTYLSKLHLDDPSIDEQAAAEYRDLEDNYPEGDFLDSDLLIRMRETANNWFADLALVPDFLHFSHGHGSTAVKSTGTNIAKKTHHMQYDRKLLNFVSRKSDSIDPFAILPPSVRSVRKFSNIRTSKVQFVAKNVEKRRAISMEHPMLMYFQQGVRKEVYHYLESKRFNERINFSDTSYNHYCAWFGSKHPDTYATVDLSSASDRVSLKLVEEVFRTTPLIGWLLATRSTHTMMGNERIKLKKFAPMGSALCFPVEAIIFALACDATLYLCGASKPYSYVVYGDDICFPSIYTEALYENLKKLGFKVNEEKSFFEGPYRESCGLEFWNGIDITSCYFRPKSMYSTLNSVIRHRLTPECFEHLCCKSNELFKLHWMVSRKYLIDTIAASSGKETFALIHCDFNRTNGILSWDLHNNKSRFNPSLFRCEVTHLSTRTPIPETELTQEDQLFYTLYENMYRDRYRDPLVYSTGRQNLQFCEQRTLQ